MLVWIQDTSRGSGDKEVAKGDGARIEVSMLDIDCFFCSEVKVTAALVGGEPSKVEEKEDEMLLLLPLHTIKSKGQGVTFGLPFLWLRRASRAHVRHLTALVGALGDWASHLGLNSKASMDAGDSRTKNFFYIKFTRVRYEEERKKKGG